MKNYVIIAAIVGTAAIVCGTVGVVHEVRSGHEVSVRETLIQDIPEDSVSQKLQERAEADDTDKADSMDNEIAIIGPDGEVLSIEDVNAGGDSSEVASDSDVVGNISDETKQGGQSVADSTADRSIIQSDPETTNQTPKDQVSVDDRSEDEVTTDGQQTYETVRIPVR